MSQDNPTPTEAVERVDTRVAFAIISEKARFHRDRAEPGSNLHMGLNEIAEICSKALKQPALADTGEKA